MSETTHTPEPWQQSHRKQDTGFYRTEVFDIGGKTIASLAWSPVALANGITVEDAISQIHGILEANARRIVAAVNACAGIPTAALEAEVIADLIDALDSLVDTYRNGYPESERAAQVVVRAEDALRQARGEAEVSS